jgi:hypothetical protein
MGWAARLPPASQCSFSFAAGHYEIRGLTPHSNHELKKLKHRFRPGESRVLPDLSCATATFDVPPF